MRLFTRKKLEGPRRRITSEQRAPIQETDSREDYTFRRGRTLTGSVSSHISSTNEVGADLKSSRVHAHILTKQRRHLGGLFSLSVAGVIMFSFLLNQFSGQIIIQSASDHSILLDEQYKQDIAAYLSDHPAEYWRFFMDDKRLSSYMKTVAPEIKTIEVKGSAGIAASRFLITPRIPIASWDVNGTLLFVDEAGVPFTRNYYESPVLTVTDMSGVPLAAGESVASNRFMGFVGEVIGRSKENGLQVVSITIPPDMTRQVEVRLEGVGYPLKLSSDRPAGEGVEDMARAIGWMKDRNLSPEYLDVRVKGKVFYR